MHTSHSTNTVPFTSLATLTLMLGGSATERTAQPVRPGQRAVKQLLLLLLCNWQ